MRRMCICAGITDLPAGPAGTTQDVDAPETPPKTTRRVAAAEGEAKTGKTASKKRQSHIDELLHKTKRGAVAKTGQAAKKAGLSKGGCTPFYG